MGTGQCCRFHNMPGDLAWPFEAVDMWAMPTDGGAHVGSEHVVLRGYGEYELTFFFHAQVVVVHTAVAHNWSW
jgi:hypothetical protein